MNSDHITSALGWAVKPTSLVLSCLVVAACSTTYYKERADNEVYSAIGEKAPYVPGAVDDFDIDQEPVDPLSEYPVAESAPEFLGDSQDVELGASVISLEDALFLAFNNNRTYRTEREVVYLTGLSLTLERDQFSPMFAASGNVEVEGFTVDEFRTDALNVIALQSPDAIRELGALTGRPADLIESYASLVEGISDATDATDPRLVIEDERTLSGQTSFGVGVLMAGGAQLAVDLTSNFLRFLTGDSRVDNSSALVATISRPLLRGGGSRVVQERLTQAERDLLYALRDFTRFRKEFAVQVASQYYRVLQNRDTVSNNFRGYLSLRRAAEREQALAEFGRTTAGDLGRRESAVLDSQDRWIQAIRNYLESLDDFKITLGLDTDAHVILDPDELDNLREDGLEPIDITSEDALKVAIVSRLDLYTDRDEVEDARRRVFVEANTLKPRLDILADYQVQSLDGNRFEEFDFNRATWSAGLDLELPLERTAERNSYRAALIDLDRSQRAYELAEDNVKLDVRNAWRNLDQARRTFEIQRINVGISEERVELEELKNALGRSTALDAIDAENDLVGSRNALTAALVGHRIAQLEFFRDMGILYVKKNGQWEDIYHDESI